VHGLLVAEHDSFVVVLDSFQQNLLDEQRWYKMQMCGGPSFFFPSPFSFLSLLLGIHVVLQNIKGVLPFLFFFKSGTHFFFLLNLFLLIFFQFHPLTIGFIFFLQI